MINIHTQSREVPNRIGGTYNPTVEMLRTEGWREEPELPPIADGYERGPVTYVEGDGVTAQAVYQDTLIADRLAAEAAANKAANLDRWILENAFLMVCQQYFGTLEKRGTKELLGKAFELVETNTKAAMTAFGVVIGLDKELVRAAGDRWWDSCVWHDDPDAVAGARAYLGV